MKPTKKEIICYGAVVIWAIGCFTFLNFFYHYHFFYQEQNQLFLLTKDYVSSYLSDGPGWLACLTGDFLTQFYYYLFLGPVTEPWCSCTRFLWNRHHPDDRFFPLQPPS